MSRAGIEQLLYMMDEAFRGDADSGQGHWHALLVNLASVRDEDWTWLPADGNRTITDIVFHVGACKFVYGSHVRGDASIHWDKPGSIPVTDDYTSPAKVISWLREGHQFLRSQLEALDDDGALLSSRPAPQGNQRDSRWLIRTMIQHDLYHCGEINHIRALAQKND